MGCRSCGGGRRVGRTNTTARPTSTRMRYRTVYEVHRPDGTSEELGDRAEAERLAASVGGWLRVARRTL